MPISLSVQEKEKMTGLRIISNLTMLLVFVQSLGLLLLQYIGLCVMVMIQGRLLRFSGRVASCNKIHTTCEACSDTVLITQYKKKKQNKIKNYQLWSKALAVTNVDYTSDNNYHVTLLLIIIIFNTIKM